MKTSVSPRARDTWFTFGGFGATALILLVLGHDGRRVGQLLVLMAPALLWMAWPVRSEAISRVRTGVVWLWAMAFTVDAVARAYLLDAYRAAPDASLVLGAAANTHVREGVEYLSLHWRSVALWTCVLAAAGLAFWRYAGRGRRESTAWPRWAQATMCLLLIVVCVAYASKPWRRLHPVIYWAQWADSIHHLRATWSDQQRAREAALTQAQAASPVITSAGPSTVVLVITDSINRDNMSLYGYARATTPRLLDQKAQLQDDLLVLRNAWSADASTLPALRNLFRFGLPDAESPQHLLALARVAGYKIWWLSNHDDVAIEQQHARLADIVEMVNRTPGRAGASLDGELLDCLQEALEDPTERKLVVVHLLGAHPHYRLRFPAGGNPFDAGTDAVEAGLVSDGRPGWVRGFRQEYDAAMLYHDFVVAESLQITRTVGRPTEHRAWMYLSDHAQEVGHESDRVGHSPHTASGYRIPTIVWNSRRDPAAVAGMNERPFRSDWAGWTIAHLLGLAWTGSATDRNVLDVRYRWEAPAIPAPVRSFVDAPKGDRQR